MKSHKGTDYNRMARYYEKVTNVVSEGGNLRSQRYFLSFMDHESAILNIGCGSIDFNLDLAQSCNNITAIDIAPKMIELAKHKLEEANLNKGTAFVCCDILTYHNDDPYDVILANFFLNTFEWDACCDVIRHIDSLLKTGGMLCIADEYVAIEKTAMRSQKIFRPIVSFLHHVWANHPLHHIYNYKPFITSLGYIVEAEKVDEKGFIVSTIYRKSGVYNNENCNN